MREREVLERRFEEQRPRLRAIAYRMLGSVTDAEDAVQEAWLRMSRSDLDVVENLNAWLTTVVGRVSLNMLRDRRRRREDSLENFVPDPVVDPPHTDPEQQAVVADAVGLALLVVLETLTPDERLAFVLHDVFAVPFDDIAGLLDRSPVAARKLASRARRRVHDGAPAHDPEPRAQRMIVDAFFAAARAGDFEALVSVLHPDVVLRADFGPHARGPARLRSGAAEVARRALQFAAPEREVHPVTVNGTAGAAVVVNGRVRSVMGFTFLGGRIASITVLADRTRLDALDLSAVGDP